MEEGTMIRWERENLDLYGYLGEVKNPVAWIVISRDSSGVHVLHVNLAMQEVGTSTNEEKLKDLAEELVARFIRQAGLHCRSCDGHACDPE